MSKEDKGKKTRSDGTREIKQVYLSEDGKEETTVSSVIKEENEPEEPVDHDKETGHKKVHAAHKVSAGVGAVRAVAIAVAMIFSLLLSMAVGVGLALWDSNKTMADLRTAMFAREVAAATQPEAEAEEVAAASTEPAPEVGTDETSPEEDAEDDEALDEVPGDEDEYGLTISPDTEGIDEVSKADPDDEIVKDDEEENDTPADPTADYPLPFTTVDESYFTDALFIGDSRLQGFGFWSGLPATYYCATGFHVYKYETTKVVQTENGKVPIFDAMPYDAFTKIYIKVGLNELGYGTEKNFEETYAQLIAKLREYEPRAVIYVHAILPVTAQKSETDKAHNNPNIVQRNAALKEFAKEQKAYFLDAGPVLSDDEGNLRPEMTSDGIHLKPEYMKIWREYLCEHAVVVK